MGKQSTRENKTFYQICREEAGLTRSEASEKMTAVSDSKIEKFEYEMQEPTPYDIIQMADAYKRPDLCNYYCSHKCEIGHRYVPEVEVSDLSNIILETIASLNEINAREISSSLLLIKAKSLISSSLILPSRAIWIRRPVRGLISFRLAIVSKMIFDRSVTSTSGT